MKAPQPLTGHPNARSSPRKPFAGFLDVRLLTGTTYRGVARDLSAGGIGAIVFADTKFANLQTGDAVEISYAHPAVAGDESVTRRAAVRGRYGNRYGFRFEQPLDVRGA